MQIIYLNQANACIMYRVEDIAGALGAYLRKRRGGIALRKFAEQLGISHTTLDNIEAGRAPELPTIEAIANGLGLDLSELFKEVEREKQPYIIQAKSETRYRRLLEYDELLDLQEERAEKKTGG